MTKIKDVKSLLQKVEEVTKQKELDLSSGEDLSIGIMNLISIEEHLFYTSQKTKDKKYLDLLNEIRLMRTSLMKEIVKESDGEVWCISKHLLAASMRIMEVGTKELKKRNTKDEEKVDFIDEKGNGKGSQSVFSKLGSLVQKAVDCCRE